MSPFNSSTIMVAVNPTAPSDLKGLQVGEEVFVVIVRQPGPLRALKLQSLVTS